MGYPSLEKYVFACKQGYSPIYMGDPIFRVLLLGNN
jgi:hypothetical protein